MAAAARQAAARQHTDAQRLTFPLQLVVLIVSSSMASGLSIWISLSGLRSDVRDIRTRMELTSEINAKDAKMLEERLNALRDTVTTLTREQRMQQLEMTTLKETLLTMGVTSATKGLKP